MYKCTLTARTELEKNIKEKNTNGVSNNKLPERYGIQL